jgi:MYXO-CTERM domain-containing protein
VSRTILVAVALAALALAPSAAAKGPHAIVEPGPEGIAPGERWLTTLTLVEFRDRELARAHPRIVLRSGSDRAVVRPSAEQVLGKGRYELSVVFPRAGRWAYAVVDGKRRFEFAPVVIRRGAERDTTAFVAFPKGSPAERQGAGGPIYGDTGPGAGGESLPPEVVVPAAAETDGGGVPLWIPAAGLALVGAGTITAVRRRRH